MRPGTKVIKTFSLTPEAVAFLQRYRNASRAADRALRTVQALEEVINGQGDTDEIYARVAQLVSDFQAAVE